MCSGVGEMKFEHFQHISAIIYYHLIGSATADDKQKSDTRAERSRASN